MGQRLARRIRVLFLKAVLRQASYPVDCDKDDLLMLMDFLHLQDIGWFDNSENSTGEIMSRLSADVSALRGKVGNSTLVVFVNGPGPSLKALCCTSGAVSDALGACIQNMSMVVVGLIIAFSAR